MAAVRGGADFSARARQLTENCCSPSSLRLPLHAHHSAHADARLHRFLEPAAAAALLPPTPPTSDAKRHPCAGKAMKTAVMVTGWDASCCNGRQKGARCAGAKM